MNTSGFHGNVGEGNKSFNAMSPDPYLSEASGKGSGCARLLHCCCALLQNLVGNSEEMRKQAEASVDVPYPPLQIVNSIPFCLFSL